jgi:hypothetical protein
VKFFRIALFVFVSILIGLAVAVYRIADIENNDAFFSNASWLGSKNLPLGKDDLLTAQVTVFALFALPGTEAIYLFAKRDDKKEKLHSSKDYVINGNVNQIKAHYWSITAYGKDLFLIPNEEDHYSFNGSSIVTDSAGNFTIRISHKRQEGNWLPLPEDARFNLVLRIYRGEAEFIEHLHEASLPQIKLAQQ